MALPTHFSPQNKFAPDFAQARCCYNHLAGALAIEITSALENAGYLSRKDKQFKLEAKGQQFFERLGIPTVKDHLGHVMTKRCIDVTHRRAHLGGPLGASLLAWMLAKDWLRKQAGARALMIPARGHTEIRQFIRAIKM